MSEKAHIPYTMLWPTQGPHKFKRCTERYVKNRLKSDGILLFEEEPLEVTAIQSEHKTVLALTDGHHRARWAPAFLNVIALPAIVLTIDEYATKENQIRKQQERPILTAFEHQRSLEASIDDAENGFDESMRSKHDRKRARRKALPVDVQACLSMLRSNPFALIQFISDYQLTNEQIGISAD